MNVALEFDRLRVFQRHLASLALRYIEAEFLVLLGESVRHFQRLGVVVKLQGLTDHDPEHVRREPALLVHAHRFLGHRPLLVLGKPLHHGDEDVLKFPLLADQKRIFGSRLLFGQLRTVGILAAVNLFRLRWLTVIKQLQDERRRGPLLSKQNPTDLQAPLSPTPFGPEKRAGPFPSFLSLFPSKIEHLVPLG